MEHFSHEHPLTFCQEKYDDDDEPNNDICLMCTLPILSSPSYACTLPTCADFILHEPCAQLPQILPNTADHPFCFELKKSTLDHGQKCNKCVKPIQNFKYQGSSWLNLKLHPLCAKPVEIKIKHKSHPQHPLVAIRKEITTDCDACGEEHKGIFFACVKCSFFIQKDCALAPSFVKHESHPHPLVLTYALNGFRDYRSCDLCEGRPIASLGLYFCPQCRRSFHMKCVSSNMEIISSESLQEYWIHLPSERDRFPNSIVKRILSEYVNNNDDGTSSKLQMIEKCHTNHPLIFHEKYPSLSSKHAVGTHASSSNSNVIGDDDDEDEEEELACNGCAQPISKTSPIWGCFQPDCNFLLHDFCATNLPSHIQDFFRAELILKTDNSKDHFNSTFFCSGCFRPDNGFGYSFLNLHTITVTDRCIECSLPPKCAIHGSHHSAGQHILSLEEQVDSLSLNCCSTDGQIYIPIYSCVTCEFKIHLPCALLPKKVSHKFHKQHPLELVFTNDDKSFKKSDCCFCEFCEEDIDQRYWFYQCAECDQSFHIKCIPSVGLLSKVKFGGRLNVSIHPRHPVILTRMLMEGSQRCGFCRKIVNGFVDDMAFCCDKCDFWIHFRCARDCCIDEHGTLLWEDRPKALRDFLHYQETWSNIFSPLF